jgi:hypothetical protein
MIDGKSTSEQISGILKALPVIAIIIAWLIFWSGVIYVVFKLAQHFWNN